MWRLFWLPKAAFFFKSNELVMIAPPPEVVINSVKERNIKCSTLSFAFVALGTVFENGYRGGQQ
jgi:hypothetical protein